MKELQKKEKKGFNPEKCLWINALYIFKSKVNEVFGIQKLL